MKRILFVCLPLMILMIITSCKEKTKKSIAEKPAPAAIEYTERLSADDMGLFRRYNYTQQNGWTRRNQQTYIKTSWGYDAQTQSVLITEGFSEFNRDMDLPLGMDNSLQYRLKYTDGKDTLIIIERSETETAPIYLPLSDIPVDPIAFCEAIDSKRREAGIYSIQHTPLNNLIEFYFSPKDQYFYIPDSIITNHEMSLDDDYLDSMSNNAVQYIQENDKMITKNWYYNAR